MLTCAGCPQELQVSSVVEAIGLGWRLGQDGKWRCPHCVHMAKGEKQ